MAALTTVNVGLTMRNIGDATTRDNIATLSGYRAVHGGTGILTTSGTTSQLLDFGAISSNGIKGIFIQILSSWLNPSAAATMSSLSGVFLYTSKASAGHWQRLSDGDASYLQPYAASVIPYRLSIRAGEYREYYYKYSVFGI